MNVNKKVSVVVCTKNNEKTIRRALESISRTKPLEIIIIDGGSSDKTLDIARRFTHRVYYDGGRGLAFARRMGAVLSRGLYVAYVDSDVEIPRPDLFEELIREMARKDWIGIHAQVKNVNKKSYWEKGMDLYFTWRFNVPGEKRHLPMMACVIRREVLLELNFDLTFKGAAEDHDFWERAFRRGYKFGVSGNQWVSHNHRSSFRSFVKQRIWYGRGNVLFFSKYKDWKRLFNPVGALIGGLIISFRSRAHKYIPFFIVWYAALATGEILQMLNHFLKLGGNSP